MAGGGMTAGGMGDRSVAEADAETARMAEVAVEVRIAEARLDAVVGSHARRLEAAVSVSRRVVAVSGVGSLVLGEVVWHAMTSTRPWPGHGLDDGVRATVAVTAIAIAWVEVVMGCAFWTMATSWNARRETRRALQEGAEAVRRTKRPADGATGGRLDRA